MSILGVPFLLVGRALGHLAGVDLAFAGHAVAFAVPALASAGAGALTGALARLLGATRRGAGWLGLGSIFATELLTYSRSYFAEPLVAFLTVLAVWGLVDDRPERRRWAYFACALVVLAKPQAALLGPALAALALAWGERRIAMKLLLATAIGSAAMAAYNTMRFSSPLEFGGEARDVDVSSLAPSELLESLALLTVSPGRGMLWFAPLAALGLFGLLASRRQRAAQAALVAATAVTAIYLTNSGTGFNWGTRYLAPAMPLLVAGVAGFRVPALRRLAVVAAVLGLIINLPNVVGFYQRFHSEGSDRGATPAQVHWSLAHGQLPGVWASAKRQIDADGNRSVRELLRPAGDERDDVEHQQLLNVVALSWWHVPAAGIPRAVGLLILSLLISAGLASCRLAARAPPTSPAPTRERRT